MRVAIDPGKTTGIAWREDDVIHGIELPREMVTALLGALDRRDERISEVVIEQFRSRPGPAVSLTAPLCIGAVEEWCAAYGVRLVFQEPSAMKRRIPKDVLRERGGWIVGRPHARDAAGHLLLREDYTSVVK